MTPEWLHAHLADSTVRVVDTRAAKSYAEGHIPGAVPLDVYSLNVTDTSADGMRAWIGQMEEALSAAGVADGQTVVFYEDVAGQFATRGLWALVYFGHDGGRLLDGGLNAWKAAGYSVTTDAAPVARTSFRARPRPEEVATYEDILARLEDGQTQIVDVRREGEFLGTGDSLGPRRRGSPARCTWTGSTTLTRTGGSNRPRRSTPSTPTWGSIGAAR